MSTLFKQIAKAVLPESMVSRLKDQRRRQQRKEKFMAHLRSTDVFFVGHPKSGNTWLAYMLGIVLQKDKSEKVTLANIGDFVPVVHVEDWSIAKYEHLPNPRIFRNEGPLYPDLYPKTIYIIRDVRAALVSYYHHCKHDLAKVDRNADDWTMDEFLDEMLTVGCIKRLEPELIRWDRQIIEWQNRAKKQPVKFVKYEDLLADTANEFRSILKFVGVTPEEELIDLAVTRGTFNSMRKQEEVHGAESFPGEKGSKGFFVRKGKVDSWREELTPAQVSRIEQTFAPVMKQMGYL